MSYLQLCKEISFREKDYFHFSQAQALWFSFFFQSTEFPSALKQAGCIAKYFRIFPFKQTGTNVLKESFSVWCWCQLRVFKQKFWKQMYFTTSHPCKAVVSPLPTGVFTPMKIDRSFSESAFKLWPQSVFFRSHFLPKLEILLVNVIRHNCAYEYEHHEIEVEVLYTSKVLDSSPVSVLSERCLLKLAISILRFPVSSLIKQESWTR